MLHQDLVRHSAEFRRYMRNHQFERTADGGLLFPKAGAIAHGVYVHDVNGLDERTDKNLLTTEGMNYLLATGLCNTALIAAWYFALYANAASPTNAWTASNFPVTNAGEITSTTEGYTESTRQALVPSTPASASTNNTASKAAFTIATATSLTVNGCGLLSVSTRGSTSGKLLSAARFGSARSLSSGDVFNLGYTLTLTSS